MFPFFGRKKSRWELARDAVADKLHEAIDVLPIERLDDWKHEVADSLHTVGKTATKKATAKTALSAASVAASAASAAENAGDVGKHLLGSAAGGVQNTLHGTAQSAHHLKESLAETLSRTSHTAHDAREALSARAAQTAEAARQHAHDSAEAARENAQQVAQATAARAAALKATLHLKHEAAHDALESGIENVGARKAQLQAAAHESLVEKTKAAKDAIERRTNRLPRRSAEVSQEIEVHQGGSKLLWTVVGLGVGVILVLFLWPKFGRRNRASLQDRLDIVKQGANEALEGATDKATDLQQRAQGLAHEVHAAATSPVGTDNPVPKTEADDRTLADRVRSELGQTAVGAGLSLNIDSVAGVISVRGPMLDSEIITQLEAIVRDVHGVRDVHIENLVSDAPEDEATFVG